MRNRYRQPRFAIAVLTALLAAASVARAGDIVVMPYRCAVVDGKPVLTPADETGHRILGAMAQQKVRTCSTVDPKRCRQWATYKFDMDCGGSRVAWMQVFANAGEHTRRRVWEKNGALRVQDTPRRSKRIDDICARRLGPSLEWSSTSELCNEVSTIDAPTATNMPAGFAPMVGLDAVFLPEDAIDMPSVRAAKTVSAAPSARVETAPIKPVAQNKSDAQGKKPVATVSEQVARSAIPTDSPQSVAMPVRTVAAGELKPVAPVAVAAPEPPMQPVTAREPASPPVEAPKAAGTDHPPSVTARADDMESAQRPEPIAEPSTQSDMVPRQETPRLTAPEPQSAVAVQNGGEGGSGTTNVYFIVVLAGGLLLATLLIVRWFGRADTSETATFERSEPTIEPLPPANEPRSQDSAPAAGGTALTIAPHHHVSGPMAATVRPFRVSIGDRMPGNKHEALELLGMGVASERNLSSLKKIIDGLRMNWHPDHACDEADRRLREVRLKQINAAWDILGGKAA